MVNRRGVESAREKADSLRGATSPAAVDGCIILILATGSGLPRGEPNRLGFPLTKISAAKSGAFRKTLVCRYSN
jgi:hypothetical protein